MINRKNIWLVARTEYIKFICNPKIIILLVVYLVINKTVISRILEAAAVMNQPVNIFEIPIAVANSWLGMLLIIISYIILISSFPQVNDNIPFCILRTGRSNWILGEILFQFMSSFTYVCFIVAVSLINGVKRAYLINGWSLVVTDYDSIYCQGPQKVMTNLIPPNLYYQMTPYKAFFMSYLLMFFLIIFCGLLFLLGCLYSRRLLFFFIQAAHIAVGCGIMQTGNAASWIFPFCHALAFRHYQPYFRKYVFPPWGSVAAFVVICIVFLIIIITKSKKVSVDMIGGSVLP